MKPIPYGRQQITEADIEAVAATLRSDFLTTGPEVAAFEREFAAAAGAPYAVAVSSGTAALHLGALALGWGDGTRVITSPMTFSASANCVRYAGGEVDFVDIDPESGLMDLGLLEQKLSAAPRGYYQGIVPVDYAGLAVDMERVAALAEAYGCRILEDSCHAPGGYFIDHQGNKGLCGSGVYADVAIFSFHPVKHIACGEGGMVTTANESLYKHLLRLRTHGITREPELLHENPGGWYYEMQELGFNYRLSDIQAALGRSQLQRLGQGIAMREQQARRYTQALAELPIGLPPHADGHAWHIYVIRTERRLELYNYLHSHQIRVQVHYIPVHYHPYYQQLGWKKGDFPHAERFYDQCLSLPLYVGLEEEQQAYVIDMVRKFFKE